MLTGNVNLQSLQSYVQADLVRAEKDNDIVCTCPS